MLCSVILSVVVVLSVIMLRVFILYANNQIIVIEPIILSFSLSVIVKSGIMLSVIVLNFIMLSVIILCAIMLSITMEPMIQPVLLVSSCSVTLC